MSDQRYKDFLAKEKQNYLNALKLVTEKGKGDLVKTIKLFRNGRYKTIGPRSYQRAATRLKAAIAE